MVFKNTLSSVSCEYFELVPGIQNLIEVILLYYHILFLFLVVIDFKIFFFF